MKRPVGPIRTRIIVRLDQFLSLPPFVQIPVIIGLTIALVLLFAIAHVSLTGTPLTESLWFALTRFLDGGSMLGDAGTRHRTIAVAVTVTGVLVVSFLTGAFASKLGERIAELRSGRSPIIARDHILILGFDAKVSTIVRELARSRERLSVVVLAKAEKGRMDALLRFAEEIPGSRLKITCRTGDPTAEVSLMRACADRARTIVVPAPTKLDDEHALRSIVSVLLSVRRAVGNHFTGRVLVESRLAVHAPLITLTGEAGLAGEATIAMDVFASDDIVARVLAQSVRDSGVYFAIRELLSFHGNELYLEPVPGQLLGKSFDDAYGSIEHGIAIGVLHADGTHRISPPRGSISSLVGSDNLIVLEENRGSFSLGAQLAEASEVAPTQRIDRLEPQRVFVLGSNRTLPRLTLELDRLLVPGSTVEIIDRPHEGAWDDPRLYQADAVVVLGCEEEADPEADASAISLLLRLRHAQRSKNQFVKQMITEVRDPILAQQIASSSSDFLVSTDVVAMLLAQVSLDHRLAPMYREILDPTGVEVFLIPRGVYTNDERACFGDIMAAARRRGEVAIGISSNGIVLNPPRDTRVPQGGDTEIVVLADPPDAR